MKYYIPIITKILSQIKQIPLKREEFKNLKKVVMIALAYTKTLQETKFQEKNDEAEEDILGNLKNNKENSNSEVLTLSGKDNWSFVATPSMRKSVLNELINEDKDSEVEEDGITDVYEISDEFNLNPLSDLEIINLAIDASIEAGVTITGSFDDATASYFGGVVVTDNKNREFIIKEKMDDYKILVYMPNFISKSGDSDVNRMRILAPLVEVAFDFAKNKDYFKALNLNGLIYASTLGFDSSIAIEALQAGAIASGLSGTGSSFVAVCNENNVDDVMDAWSGLEGRVLQTHVDNDGCVFL
jgi:hypothetical protein